MAQGSGSGTTSAAGREDAEERTKDGGATQECKSPPPSALRASTRFVVATEAFLYRRTVRAVLIAWVGVSDLKGPEKAGTGDLGPIAQALAARSFDQVVLLEFFDKADHQKLLPGYIAWLRERTQAEIVERRETLRGPTDFGGIYEAARRACQEVLAQHRDATLTFHLSPGSPPMAAVWMLLGKTIFPAQLIESSREQGVKTAEVPFDIAAEFLPDLLREPDERLRAQSTADSPPAPEFKTIIHRSRVMARLIQRARRVALRNVPVLIEGESGTGKELLAKAIHQASPRKGKPFIPVNCGAIPASLVESRLRSADVILGYGGSNLWAAHAWRASGLAPVLAELLEQKVYVGWSAGSMIFARELDRWPAAFDDLDELAAPFGRPRRGADVVEWGVAGCGAARGLGHAVAEPLRDDVHTAYGELVDIVRYANEHSVGDAQRLGVRVVLDVGLGLGET